MQIFINKCDKVMDLINSITTIIDKQCIQDKNDNLCRISFNIKNFEIFNFDILNTVHFDMDDLAKIEEYLLTYCKRKHYNIKSARY